MTEEPNVVPATSMPWRMPAMSEGDAMIAMIERMARDPSVDLDRLERALATRKDIIADNARAAFDRAMSTAQAEMTRVSTDAVNPQTHSKYATLGAIDQALRPIYTKHGFAVSFDQGEGAPELHVRVLAFVSCAGHRQTFHLDMPADGKGAKGGEVMTRTHATMSAVSYGRRGLLKMIFNIAEEDDDGNAAGRKQAPVVDTTTKVNAEQLENLRSLIVRADNVTIESFCKDGRIDRIEDLLASRYDSAVKWLQERLPIDDGEPT